MSDNELAQKIAGMLKPTAENAAKAAIGSQMKSLKDILGTTIETCIDGKCDAIATKAIEKLQPELNDIKSKVKDAMTIKGHTPHDLWDCPTCKPVAIDHLLKDETHRGGLLETVCTDGVCRPIVAETLWKDEDYRKDVLGKLLKDEEQRGPLLEGICTDEACRNDIFRILKEKNIEVSERGRDETWAQQRLRERKERSGTTG